MKRIWGFDLGTTSVGFAVFELDEEKGRGRIQHEGTRIFPEGRTEKDLEPRNKARRAARLIRRQIRRRRLRRRFLRRALAEAGLLPWFNTVEQSAARPFRKLPRGGAPSEEWEEAMKSDPYLLRSRGLNQALQPFEIGAALYHLAQRRGFKSARLVEETDKQKKKEEGKVKEAITGLRGEMGEKTLGEHLAGLPESERKRDRYLGRDMIEEEFKKLWEAQARFHPKLLTKELEEELEGIIFYQRPVFWRLKTLGTCWLEPGEPVCPAGSWIGQQFVLLQGLNNLRLAGMYERPLTGEERAKALALLEGQATVTWGKLRKTLGLPKDSDFNLEAGDEKKMLGNALETKLRGIFKKEWDNHPSRNQIQREIHQRLYKINYERIGNKRIEIRFKKQDIEEQRRQFIEEAQSDFGITAEQAEQLTRIVLPNEWLRFSEKAIEKLLPHMKQGLRTDEALDKVYPGHRQPETQSLQRLPSRTLMRRDQNTPEAASRSLPDLRNPTVMRALHELRKVVNNLIRTYGKPDLIRIELARDLKLGKKKRDALNKLQNEQRRKREKAKTALAEESFKKPSGTDIEKWLLWQECNKTCPYTGRKISPDDLFRNGEFQIEHIHPLSRSLNNTFINKTLCAADINRRKGNQTPFEFFREDPEKWEAVTARIRRLVRDNRMPKRKAERFLREDWGEENVEELAERQLRDTSYIATEARKLLERLGVKVQVTNGRATAQLRWLWGLDSILDPEGRSRKNRADHRHHAVDALVVALTSPAFIKRLSEHYAREKRVRREQFPEPWPNFRQEADEKTKAIVVSHRVQRKLSGRFHEQTALGLTAEKLLGKGKTTLHRFVKRKPIRELSDKEISFVRDEAIKQLLVQLSEKHGDLKKVPEEEFRLPSRTEKPGRIIRKVRLYVDRQMKAVMPLCPEPKTYAELGQNTNHHIAVYDLGNGEAGHETVTRLEAVERLAQGEAAVRRTWHNGGRFVLSLCPGDILEVTNPSGSKEYLVVRKFNEEGRVFYKPLHSATKPKPEISVGPNRFLEPDIRKVSVDPIGRVRPAND